MIWLLSVSWAEDIQPCGTLEALKSSPVRQGPSPRLMSYSSSKQERDSFGSFPNSLQGENVVIKWGTQGGIGQAEAQEVLDLFEHAWEVMVSDWEHLPPWGTEDYLFNVYIGDTGDGTPSSNNTGGYFSADDEGWPMIVIPADVVLFPELLEVTVVHEFYHAIQGREQRFSYSGEGAWLWEATATWASGQFYPNSSHFAIYLFSYIAFSNYEVNFFDYYDTGNMEELYQYGAFIFPYHLTEFVDPNIVPNIWMDEGTEEDPIEVFRELLAEQGEDLDTLWLDHCAHLVVYDYEHGELFRSVAIGETYQSSYDGSGTDGFIEVSNPGLMRYGFFAHKVTRPDFYAYKVQVTANPIGSQNSTAYFGARVVHVDGAVVNYYEMDFDNDYAEVDVDSLSNSDELWVVVGAWSDSLIGDTFGNEEFSYEFSITPTTEEPAESSDGSSAGENGSSNLSGPDFWGAEDEACGCSSAAPIPAAFFSGLFALYWRQRRG